jgi:hypothetical protein
VFSVTERFKRASSVRNGFAHHPAAGAFSV